MITCLQKKRAVFVNMKFNFEVKHQRYIADL